MGIIGTRVLACTYLSWDEYQVLCPKDWSEKYGPQRCHLWDTTDIRLKGMPSAAMFQHLMYSVYYGGYVCKGGVGCIPGGWCMCAPLWSGGVSDTVYMKASGILED